MTPGFQTKLLLLFIMVFSLFLTPVSGQTALRIEEMLAESALNWSDVAMFALEASGQIELTDPQEAFNFAKTRNWLPRNAQIGESARLNGVALLLMRSFNLKGGIFYTIIKNSHYAYRELVYRDIIQGRADPDMRISGDDFLFIIGRILSYIDDTPAVQLEQNEAPPALVLSEEDAASKHLQQEALAAEINLQLAALENTKAEVTSEGITITLSNIQFLANSAVLSESERQKLREIADILKTIPGKNILVSGHTAMAGTRVERQSTSLQRAQAAASYLVALGARRINEITVHGYGADRPIADNGTPQGMEANRRVEITILD
jgi:outer membrane protein OmpA-like peptidoglycan-associated protein